MEGMMDIIRVANAVDTLAPESEALASIRLELEAERSNHRRDNEFLLERVGKAEKAANAYPKLVLQAKLYLTLQKQYIKDCGPCDHDVGICVCGLIAEAEDTAALMREL